MSQAAGAVTKSDQNATDSLLNAQQRVGNASENSLSLQRMYSHRKAKREAEMWEKSMDDYGGTSSSEEAASEPYTFQLETNKFLVIFVRKKIIVTYPSFSSQSCIKLPAFFKGSVVLWTERTRDSSG